ncbi:hypothetical protein BJ742DRAFT_736536 [Cladochytrium replicatum]|nr:hypothetical protein BJ742DRAFT_736536 [Cladochytrium replicatum]
MSSNAPSESSSGKHIPPEETAFDMSSAKKRAVCKKPGPNVHSKRTHIVDLSNEVLGMILSHVTDLPTLLALIQTCKRISNQMDPSTIKNFEHGFTKIFNTTSLICIQKSTGRRKLSNRAINIS